MGNATQWRRSVSTYAAQTARAFVTDSRTILITSPGGPETAAIQRETSPGLNGAGASAGVGAVVALTVASREGPAGARGRPPFVRLADLRSDAAGRCLEGLRGGHRAAALRRAHP